jgi:hypothetical protein
MPRVEVFQERNTGELLLCQFALCTELGIGDSPTGPLVPVQVDEFLENAADIVAREFEEYYTRDYRIRSGLYEVMPRSERRRFFESHSVVGISWPTKSDPVKVYIGEDHEPFGTIAYPFEKNAFSELICRAFAAASERRGKRRRKRG